MSPASPRYFCFLNAITAVITGRNHLHTWGSLNRYTLWIVPFLLYVLLQTTFSVEAMANENGSVDGGTTKVQVQETYGKLPLYFIQNNGQVDEKVKFYEKGSGHATYLTKEGVYISLASGHQAGGNNGDASHDVTVAADLSRQLLIPSFLIGKRSDKWVSHIDYQDNNALITTSLRLRGRGTVELGL